MKSRFYNVILPLGLALAATPALAVTTIRTSAYALFSDITATNVISAAIGPLAATSGMTSPGYTANSSVASLNTSAATHSSTSGLVTTTTGLHIGTGAMKSTSTAKTNAQGSPIFGSGSSQVDNLGASLFTQVGAISMATLGLTADTLGSTTVVARTGRLTAAFTGKSQYENLSVKLLGLVNFGLGANATVVPNTVLVNDAGIKITLNEQLMTGVGALVQSFETNAISVVLTNYGFGGRFLTGHLIIGNSKAEINFDPDQRNTIGTVPEPAVWLQLITGFGLIGAAMRRRAARRLA